MTMAKKQNYYRYNFAGSVHPRPDSSGKYSIPSLVFKRPQSHSAYVAQNQNVS